MPKKRQHWTRYSKPQSTAPHSLESSGLQSNIHHEEPPRPRSVNDILAGLRRATLASNAGSVYGGSDANAPAAGPPRLATLSPVAVVSPSVPPEIAHILLPLPPPPPTTRRLTPEAAAAAAHSRSAHDRAVRNNALAVGTGSAGSAGGAGGAGAQRAAAGRHRRPPAGPAPPPSWLSRSRHAPRRAARTVMGHWTDEDRREFILFGPHRGLGMPGIALPARGSLVDVLLRNMVLDWDVHRKYYQYDLAYLHGSLRAALVSYLSQLSEDGQGITVEHLRALLLPPPDLPLQAAATANGSEHREGEHGPDDDSWQTVDEDSNDEELPSSPTTMNRDFYYLDLSRSMGQSISVRELSDLLFPGKSYASPSSSSSSSRLPTGSDLKHNQRTQTGTKIPGGVLDSWDAPPGDDPLSPPRALLPNLTHLSLALAPGSTSAAAATHSASWRHLLAFAVHLPMLTHLSLAYWPEPTLTPNAKLAMVVSPQGRRLPYGGTGAYSHTLDNDWAEAVLLVRKLSKALYGLEYLDLTGCAPWFPALMHKVEGSGQVDWVGDWGKVATLVLSYGSSSRSSTGVGSDGNGDSSSGGGDSGSSDDGTTTGQAQGQGQLRPGEVARRVNAASEARMVERHIRQQRAGRGRFITVEYDQVMEATR